MALDDDTINEDLSIMNERMAPSKVLDAKTFMEPIRNINPSTPVTIDIDDSLQDALMFMQMKQFGCVLITQGNELAGILTERDIIAKAIGQNDDMNSMKIKDIMTPNPESFHEEDPIAYVMRAMTIGGYRHVPIIDMQNRPVGVVSVKDIIRFIVEHFAEEVMNLPPKPVRTAVAREGA